MHNGYAWLGASVAGKSRALDKATSKDATKSDKTTIAQRILDLLMVYKDGLVGTQIALILNVRLNSVTPRFAQLRRLGLIKDHGVKDKETVWVYGYEQ